MIILLPALALFVAFGMEPLFGAVRIRPEDVPGKIGEVLTILAMAAAVASGLGFGLAAGARISGESRSRRANRFARVRVIVEWANLLFFAWIIHGLGWSRVVRRGFGLGNTFVLDEFLIFLPYLLIELFAWVGLLPALKACLAANDPRDPRRIAWLQYRVVLGASLPLLLIFGLSSDLYTNVLIGRSGSAFGQYIGGCVLVFICLGTLPAIFRLAVPTVPLEKGDLRDRITELSDRIGIKFTDILVWKTGRTVANAAMTGVFPWYRYLVLTDALVDSMGRDEIVAVCGHEMGHVRHRHLAYFAFLAIAGVGFLASAEGVFDRACGRFGLFEGNSALREGVKAAGILAGMMIYYRAIVVEVSRRFELQADLFGSKAASDSKAAGPPSPEGMDTFVRALFSVASLNGIDPTYPMLLHGSIMKRVEFLRQFQGNHEAERRFQRGMTEMRWALAASMIVALFFLLRLDVVDFPVGL